MKTRHWGVLTGIVVIGLLAVTVTACGGGTKATVSTLVGKARSPGYADGSGTATLFDDPTSVACDATGNLYVTDTWSATIRKITPAGEVTTVAGTAGSMGSADGKRAEARFYFPIGIACDAAGNLYVTDAGDFTIRKITPGGNVTTLAGMAGARGSADVNGAAARFSDPRGIACDAAGNVYVADLGNDVIRKITPGGEVTTFAGQAGASGSADGNGAAARFSYPFGIACDTAGNLYVTDAGNYTIRKITPGGDVTTLAGKAGDSGSTDGNAAEARFQQARAIACDAAGNLYVADSGSDTIRRMTPAGEVTTLAGKHSSIGSTDGSGAAARFDFPTGIVCDATGDLYVSDSQNHTIRKITLSH